ncbi:MAG: hypothetical protein PUP92_12020 [Rhizonema sp. PD38]|nr:hypothetical protein [Rhizonema sp. PD38]
MVDVFPIPELSSGFSISIFNQAGGVSHLGLRCPTRPEDFLDVAFRYTNDLRSLPLTPSQLIELCNAVQG